MKSSSPPQPDYHHFTMSSILSALAQSYGALINLDSAYAALEQRLNAHLQRAQLLSNALAAERAQRLALQARVAELERILTFIGEADSLQERAVKEN